MAFLMRKDQQADDDGFGPDPAAVIDAEELAAARADPKVQAFLAEADAYLSCAERRSKSDQHG